MAETLDWWQVVEVKLGAKVHSCTMVSPENQAVTHDPNFIVFGPAHVGRYEKALTLLSVPVSSTKS